MNNNRTKVFVFLLFYLFTFLPLRAQFRINLGGSSPLRKLQIAEMAINNLYVDTVNEEKLVEDAIKGMLKELDPHSTYANAKEVKAMNEPLQGNFDGIGVQFNMVEDTLLVIQPTTNGPSEKVGIVAGDRIVTVNDTAIAGVKMSKEEIMKRLRGPRGTKVKLGIVRRSVKEMLYFTVKRDKIPVKSIDAVYMIRPQVGYIRIGSFGATTHKEFMEGVEKLKAQGMRDLTSTCRPPFRLPMSSSSATTSSFTPTVCVPNAPNIRPTETENFSPVRSSSLSMNSRPQPRKSSQAPFRIRTVEPS